MPKFPCRKLLIALGIALQLALPAWMIAKRACVMAYGERILLRVTVQDPRDLWMGHWVRLSPVDPLLERLENLPNQNFLRYYCDQRYARPLETALSERSLNATLEVRLWHGTALAADLTVEGLPAYAFIEQLRTQTPPAEANADNRFAEPVFPLPLFRQIDRDYLTRIASAFNAPLTLPVDRELLTHELFRKCLLAPERRPFLPPRAVEARKDAWSSMLWRYRSASRNSLPLFAFPPASDLPLTSAEGFKVVCNFFNVHDGDADLLMSLPEGITAAHLQTRLAKGLPEMCWLLPCAGPLPEGLSPERLILICSPDAPPPARFTWFARTPYPCGELPPGAQGWFIEASPFRLPPPPDDPAALLAEAKAHQATLNNPDCADRFIEAFAALANTRYAQTQDPRLAACFDELLLYHSWRTCDALYNAVTTPEAYGQALDFIRAQQPPGALLPLGGGLNAKPERIPTPAQTPNAMPLLLIAEELLER